MKYAGWLLALLVAVSAVAVADPILDRLDAIDVQLSGLSFTLDNVRDSVGDLSDQLAVEADEIKVTIFDRSELVLFRVIDFGEALVDMSFGLSAQVQNLHDALGDELDWKVDIVFSRFQAQDDLLDEYFIEVFDAISFGTFKVSTRLWDVETRLNARIDAVDAKLDQLLEYCATLGGFEGSLEEVLALLNYIIDTLPPGWDKKANH